MHIRTFALSLSLAIACTTTTAVFASTQTSKSKTINTLPPALAPVDCHCRNPELEKQYIEDSLRAQKKFGQSSAEYAASLLPVAQMTHLKGKDDDALKIYRQSLAIRTKIFGETSHEVAEVLSGIGQIYLAQNKPEQARTELERTMEIENKLSHGQTYTASVALAEQAALYKTAFGDFAKSDDLYEQALALRAKLMPETDRRFITLLDEELYTLPVFGDTALAQMRMQQALQLHMAVDGPHNAQTLWVKQVMASYAFYRLHKPQQARHLLEEILAVREPVLGAEHQSLEPVLKLYGAVLAALGDGTGSARIQKRLDHISKRSG